MVVRRLALGTAAVDAGGCCPDRPLPQENSLHLNKSCLLSKGRLHPMTSQCGMWRPGSLARPALAIDVLGEGLRPVL